MKKLSTHREKVSTVYSSFEQVQKFVRFAYRYRNDFLDFPEMQKFLDFTPEELHSFLVNSYTREEGEQIIRPKLYYQLRKAGYPGGDCDDGTCFALAIMFAVRTPWDKVLIVEAKEQPSDSYYCHIFAGYIDPNGKKIFIDNLPGTSPKIHDYASDCVKITKASEYLP